MSRQCTPETQPELREQRARGRDELSTHRMSVDEVRAFIRQFEPEPPPRVVADASDHELEALESSASPEPPTLLYRGRRRVAPRAVVPEPGTLLGWGAGAWLETARELTRHPRGKPDARAASSTHAIERASLAPAHGPCRAPAPCRAARGAPRRPSARLRVRVWRRRVRWAAGVLAALVLSAPLAMISLRSEVDATSEPITTDPTAPALPEPALRARMNLPDGVTLSAEGATQQRMEDVRRATTLMMTGDSAGALAAFRALSRGWPEHPTLPRVVRLLEDELRACAARGGAACR